MRKIIIIAILLISACLSYGQNKAERLSITEKNYLAYKICMMQIKCNFNILNGCRSKDGIYKFNKEKIHQKYDTSACNILSYYDYMHTRDWIQSYRIPSVLDKLGFSIYAVFEDFSNGHVLGITDRGVVYLFKGFTQNDFQKFVANYIKKIDSEEKAWKVCKIYYDIVNSCPFVPDYDRIIDKENINKYLEYTDKIKPIEIKKIKDGYEILFYIINDVTRSINFKNMFIDCQGNVKCVSTTIRKPDFYLK